jgi:hypothetical protein
VPAGDGCRANGHGLCMRWLIAAAASLVALVISTPLYASTTCFDSPTCTTQGEIAGWAMWVAVLSLVLSLVGLLVTRLLRAIRNRRGR